MPDTQDSRRIQVLLVDDYPLYIETLALCLDDRIEIVAGQPTVTGREAA